MSGRVQGVFFRQSVRQVAYELGLQGWVRNLADGRVEAVFEGESDAVESALAFAREGPRLAQVTGVEVIEESPQGIRGFEVRR